MLNIDKKNWSIIWLYWRLVGQCGLMLEFHRFLSWAQIILFFDIFEVVILTTLNVWHIRVNNHDLGYLVAIWRSSQEDVVFLFSGKCHKVSHCKVVQTLKVENQLENSLPFWPLEQSCDIRGENVWKQTKFQNNKHLKFWNLRFHKSFLQFQG